MTVEEFNALDDNAAAVELTAICGATLWGRLMLARRPFASPEAIRSAAAESWQALGPGDWLDAVTHHPRIGSGEAAHPTSARAQSWSSGEQAGARAASEASRRQFAGLSAQYERMFGRPFIICATGMSLDDMGAALERRLAHDPDTELGATADELRRITLLRVDKLVAHT